MRHSSNRAARQAREGVVQATAAAGRSREVEAAGLVFGHGAEHQAADLTARGVSRVVEAFVAGQGDGAELDASAEQAVEAGGDALGERLGRFAFVLRDDAASARRPLASGRATRRPARRSPRARCRLKRFRLRMGTSSYLHLSISLPAKPAKILAGRMQPRVCDACRGRARATDKAAANPPQTRKVLRAQNKDRGASPRRDAATPRRRPPPPRVHPPWRRPSTSAPAHPRWRPPIHVGARPSTLAPAHPRWRPPIHVGAQRPGEPASPTRQTDAREKLRGSI